MRTRKYRIITAVERVNNRITRWSLRRGIGLSAFALLETTGRRTGKVRHTPVGNGAAGDTFWLIAAHGDQADYVRNMRADPRVRVKIRKQWRSGTATLLPDDDVHGRSRTLPYQWDALFGRMIATTPMTIRIDLDPLPTGAEMAP